MAVSLPYPSLAAGATIDQSQLNSNFTTLTNKFGTIDNSDIKTGASIDINKLSASYEYMVIRFTLADMTSTSNIDVCPFYNDGLGDWTYVATQWATQDTGAATGIFQIGWGQYNGAASNTIPALTTTSTIDTITLTGSEIQSQASDSSPAVTTLASGSGRMLWAKVSTADSTAGQKVYISCLLKRQIAT